MTDKKLSLEDIASGPSIRRIADVFHYLVVVARIKQYYYELKFVRDGKLLELMGKALRDIDTLSNDKNMKKEISKLATRRIQNGSTKNSNRHFKGDIYEKHKSI